MAQEYIRGRDTGVCKLHEADPVQSDDCHKWHACAPVNAAMFNLGSFVCTLDQCGDLKVDMDQVL